MELNNINQNVNNSQTISFQNLSFKRNSLQDYHANCNKKLKILDKTQQLTNSNLLEKNTKKLSIAHKKLQAIMEAQNIMCKISKESNKNFIVIHDEVTNSNNKTKIVNNEKDMWLQKKFGLLNKFDQEVVKEKKKQKYESYKKELEEKLMTKRRKEIERRHCFFNADNELYSNKDEEEEEEIWYNDEDEETFVNAEDVTYQKLVSVEEINKKKTIFSIKLDEKKETKDFFLKQKVSDEELLKNDFQDAIIDKNNYPNFMFTVNSNHLCSQNSIFNTNEEYITNSYNNETSHILLNLTEDETINEMNKTSKDYNEALFLCSGTFDLKEKIIASTSQNEPFIQLSKTDCVVKNSYNSTSIDQKIPGCNNFQLAMFNDNSLSNKLLSDASESSLSNYISNSNKKPTQNIIFSDSEDSNLSMNSYLKDLTQMTHLNKTNENSSIDWSLHKKDFQSLYNYESENEAKSTKYNLEKMSCIKFSSETSSSSNTNDNLTNKTSLKSTTSHKNLLENDDLYTVEDEIEDDFIINNYHNDHCSENSSKNSDSCLSTNNFKIDKNKLILKDLLDDEASLSGSDVDSDSDDEANDNNEYEEEDGDNDNLPDANEIRENLIKQYIKQTNDEEEQRILRLQEKLLVDSDLHSGRNIDRSFRLRNNDEDIDWSKILGKLDDDLMNEENNDSDCDENDENIKNVHKEMNEKKVEMLKWKLEQEKMKTKFNNSFIKLDVFDQNSLLSLGRKFVVKETEIITHLNEDEKLSTAIVQRDSLLNKSDYLMHIVKDL